MFRIESYITSIILSYVDRYIKNFRRQDAQLSLWEGDGSLHNLDLDLEVLEQELNLPFSFVSGHIHDLLIHVPWTRIASEPVRITINTIECVMKLKTQGATAVNPEKRKRKVESSTSGEEGAAPTYMSSLVNKIVCNLSVTCNNLILKYVEDDIVLSMNIKTLSLNTVNSKWLRQFSELTPTQLILRKLIDLTDVTICLDKRNASGRIESYLEPLLYKCSLTIRLSRSYTSVNATKANATRVGVKCQTVALSISEPQVSMLMRLALLARMTINRPNNSTPTSPLGSDVSVMQDGEGEDDGESWASWAWSWVPAVLPTTADTSSHYPSPTHTLHLGIYLDNFTVDFKLVRGDEGKSWESVVQGWLGGCFCEMMTNSSSWTNIQVGVCQVAVQPVPPTPSQMKYVSCGEIPHTFYSFSLFENPDTDLPHRGWDLHLATITESIMLERAPFFAMDYLSSIEGPPGFDPEFNLPSDMKEKVLTRYVFGPLEINLCSTLIQRLALIYTLLYNYDYLPYTLPPPNPPVPSKSREDIADCDSDIVQAEPPKITSQFTTFGAAVRLYHAATLTPIMERSPHILMTTRCLDGKLVRTLPDEQGVPLETSLAVMMLGVQVSLVVGDSTEMIQFPHVSTDYKLITENNVNIQRSYSIHIDSFSAVGSKTRLLTVQDIVNSNLYLIEKKTSPHLLHEYRFSPDDINLRLGMEEVRGKYIEVDGTGALTLSVGTAEGFTFKNKSKIKEEVLKAKSPDGPVFQVILQKPLLNDICNQPRLLVLRLKSFGLTVQPTLVTWFTAPPGFVRKVSSGSMGSGRPPESTTESTHNTEQANIRKEEEVRWVMGAVVCCEMTEIFISVVTGCGHSLVLTFPRAHARSSHGTVTAPLDVIPVTLPNSVWTPEKSGFPWAVGISDIEAWTVIGQKQPLVGKVSLTCTIAMATRSQGDKPSLCLHLDTTPLIAKLSKPQVSVINDLMSYMQSTVKPYSKKSLAAASTETSDETPPQPPKTKIMGVKWWVQWTLARFNLNIYSDDQPSHIKMVLDIDDLFMTLDIDRVYQKLKLKIATISIHHFVRDSFNWPWKVGVYKGIVMKGQDSKSSLTEMLSLTLTRASAENLQAKLNTPIHTITRRGGDEWIIEAVVRMEPVVVIGAPKVIGRILDVFEPMRGGAPPKPQPPPLLTSASLPLIYFDLASLRAFLPASPNRLKMDQNVLIVNVEGISLKSEAVNPVSRKMVRTDVARVTGWEDRQYQLDLILDISSGSWSEVESELEIGDQNPAVYWNNPHPPPLSPLLAPVTLSLILAPPIVATGFIVSGLTIEVNVVSEIEAETNCDQVRLVAILLEEISAHLLQTPKPLQNPVMPTDLDSGVESSDGSTPRMIKETSENINSIARSCSLSQLSISTPSITTKRSRHRSQAVPIDILLTGKGICVKVYSQQSSRQIPLLYASISQPYVSLEKQGDTTIYKGSVFEVELRVGEGKAADESRDSDTGGGNGAVGRRLDRERFSRLVMETRSGDPDPYKGIPPALLNIKAHQQGLRPPTIDIELGRPTKLTVSLSLLDFLNYIKNELTSCLVTSEPPLKKQSWDRLGTQQPFSTVGNENPKNENSVREEEPEDFYTKLKNWMHQVNEVSFSTKQIALDLQDSKGGGGIFSWGKATGNTGWVSGGRQLKCSLEVGSVTVSTRCEAEAGGSAPLELAVGPWALSASSSLSWEPPYVHPLPPLLRLSILSEFLTLSPSIRHWENLRRLLKEFLPLIYSTNSNFTDTQPNNVTSDLNAKPQRTSSDDDEEVYKDDLQAGAFQFMNTGLEIPLAYQVTFPTRTIMAWTYPAPRAITRVHLLPLPLRDEEDEDEVRVRLEWWDGSGWVGWGGQRGVVAASWRARLEAPPSAAPPVEALAAALRLDSLYSPRLLPKIYLSLTLGAARLIFSFPSPPVPVIPHYTEAHPSEFPPYYLASALVVNNMHLITTVTQSGGIEVEWKTRVGVDVVNCRRLEDQKLMEAVEVEGTGRWGAEGGLPQVTILQGHTSICLSPTLIRTLHSAATSQHIAPYVICNDSSLDIKFGQFGTVEEIELGSRQCQHYSWRSTRHPMSLRFSIQEGLWSKGVNVHKEDKQGLEVEDEWGRKVTLVVCISNIASTLTKVTVMGQLVLKSLLEVTMEVRLVSSSIAERQRACEVPPCARAPSLPLSAAPSYSLRLATHSHWSGLIPIKSQSDAWLVKVPQEDRQEFVSIWCQIFWEKDVPTPRCLVLLSPIYMLRSMLPCEANVLIVTEELKTTKTQKVAGQGAYTNLNTPGTTVHTHSLTFHIEGNLPASSPHLSLNYNIIDGPPKPTIPPIEQLLDWADEPVNQAPFWPLLGPDWESYPWQPALQPGTVTHIKVRLGGDSLRVSNSVLVELQPWAIMANSLGLTLSVYEASKLLCSLPDYSVLAPPSLEETFYLSVELNDKEYRSSGLQLSKGQAFYMPHIAGLIPHTGSIQVDIQASHYMVSAAVESRVVSGIRVMEVRSSCIVMNISDINLKVAGFLVKREPGRKLHIPATLPQSVQLLATPPPSKPRGERVCVWTMMGAGGGDWTRYLIFECDNGVCCPVRLGTEGASPLLLPPPLPPLTAVVQRKNSVTYVVVDHQPHPQLEVHNDTIYPLLLATQLTLAPSPDINRTARRSSTGGEENDDWEFWVEVEAGGSAYFHVPQDHGLVLARSHFPTGWSGPIVVGGAGGVRLVNIAQCQDLAAAVHRRGFTTHVFITPASHDIISASDIRTRLSLQSNSSSSSFEGQMIEGEVTATLLGPRDHVICSPKDGLQVKWFMRGLTAVLCSESPESFQYSEVAALTLTDVAITIQPNDCELETSIGVSDIQLDNQEYRKGGYDFGVVIVRGREKEESNDPCPSPQFSLTDVPELVDTVAKEDPTLHLTLILDTHSSIVLEEVKMKIGPLELYLEDTYLSHLRDELLKLLPPTPHQKEERTEMDEVVSWAMDISRPLRLRYLEVSEVRLSVSLHTSTRFYIAVDHSPLTFTPFTRKDVLTTSYRLGHALTLHYFFGAIYGTGWALGSLQLLGAPAGLARSVGCGLKSFVTLPYRGFMQGPSGFLMGILHGSASLMKHVTAGTLMSVTKFASSWSRTLDRLTLGEEDLRYAEEMRRLRPQGFTQALRQGLTELGVSILGGVGGVAGQPLHGTDGLVGSVGRGLMGLMARPLSGAAELVALTGHGILSGAGWAHHHTPKHGAVGGGRWDGGQGSVVKYWWKVAGERVLEVAEAVTADYRQVTLLVTSSAFLVVADDDGSVMTNILLGELTARSDRADPTLLRIYMQSSQIQAERLCQKRIAEYVRSAAGAEGEEGGGGWWTPEGEPLLLGVHPQLRNHLLAVIDMATRHQTNRGFHLIS